MINVTRSEAEKLLRTAERAKAHVKLAKEKTEEAVAQVVQTTEVGSAAFGMGVVNARYGGVQVVGVPVDAGAGLLLHAAAFVVDGDTGKHLHNFGDGCLASYLTTMGAAVGAQMRAKAGIAALPGGKTTAGWFPGQGGPLSDQQLHDLARSA